MIDILNDLTFIERPPFPERVLYSSVGIALAVLTCVSLVLFVYNVVRIQFASDEYILSKRRPLRPVFILAGIIIVAFLGVGLDGYIQDRNHDMLLNERDELSRDINDQVIAGIEDYYGVGVDHFTFPPVSQTDYTTIDIISGQSTVETCFLHVISDQYKVSCGGETLETSTELERAN